MCIVEKLAKTIPITLYKESGAVFYSGRSAFNKPSDLYILGLNPGGSAEDSQNYTIKTNIDDTLNNNDRENWSEYRDGDWGGKPGTKGMQPRVLHLLKELNLDPQSVPASNVVFARTVSEHELGDSFLTLANQCWAFHEAVISNMKVKVILCFGQTAGYHVATKLNVIQKHTDLTFTETNKRKYVTDTYSNSSGQYVIITTHPSRVNWGNPDSDPSDLVKKVLDRC